MKATKEVTILTRIKYSNCDIIIEPVTDYQSRNVLLNITIKPLNLIRIPFNNLKDQDNLDKLLTKEINKLIKGLKLRREE
jgi:hypothetical protein